MSQVIADRGVPFRCDGLPSDCVLLYSWSDVVAHDHLAGKAPPEAAVRIKTRAREMYRFASSHGCRHQRLAAHFGEKMAACGTCCDCCTTADLIASRGSAGSSEWPVDPAVLGGSGQSQSELLTRLKALRREFASTYRVPPCAVFSNAALCEIVVRRPASESDLLEIPGIGRTKLARYGRQLLRLLAAGQDCPDR
jgi:ATP-dependent DNA helicase RecQ